MRRLKSRTQGRWRLWKLTRARRRASAGVEGAPRIGDTDAQWLVTEDVLGGAGGGHYLVGMEHIGVAMKTASTSGFASISS